MFMLGRFVCTIACLSFSCSHQEDLHVQLLGCVQQLLFAPGRLECSNAWLCLIAAVCIREA